MISQFKLKCQEKACDCLKYGSAPDPAGGAYSAIFHNLLSTASTL